MKLSDLVEKEGLKVTQETNEPMFMKLKIAKFVVNKTYQQYSLQELLDQKKKALSYQYSQQQINYRQSTS